MKHGILSTYTNGGCRCDRCRKAMSTYSRERYARLKKEATPAPVKRPRRVRGSVAVRSKIAEQCMEYVRVSHPRVYARIVEEML